MIWIEDVGRDLRPVHPAALRLARIVQHAGGQLQFGVGELVGRGGGSEIRHRIIGGIEAFGGGVLQAGDDALAAVGQFAGLGPLRRVFTRAVELLDRGALGLAVESAQRFAAEHFAQFVGDRLIGGGNVARGLHRLLGRLRRGRRGGRGRRRGRRRGRGIALRRFVLGGFGWFGFGGGRGDDFRGLRIGRLGGRARRCRLGGIGRR